MRMTDLVAEYIMNMLESCGGHAEIQRNELAEEMGCVPSQINYVLTSRFTPEQGYVVESRRGGGGYIRITKIKMDKSSALMHAIHSIGPTLDSSLARAILMNLVDNQVVSKGSCMSDFRRIVQPGLSSGRASKRDALRASLFKNMLITLI